MADPKVTMLLGAVNDGEHGAYDRLLSLVYTELRQLAGRWIAGERPGHTLQPTALVNEAFLRLVDNDQWQNRAHFFGAAAQAMRRVLVDHARKRASLKRGADGERVTFTEMQFATPTPDVDVLALDDALSALERESPRHAKVVHLRYFAGLSIEETAALMDVAPATVKRDWTFARAWLFEHMGSA